MAESFFVGVCRIELQLPGARSLKDKRAVVQSATMRLRRQFQVSVAEVEAQDVYRRAVLGLAAVSNQASHAQAVLEAAVRFIEDNRLDAEVSVVEMDVLPVL